MEPIYIGIKGRVLCIDRQSGTTRWETHLFKSYFVNVHRDGDEILAATHGELFCLDAHTGAIKWRHDLPGLGRGLITIAGSAGNLTALEQQQQNEQAAAATGSASGAA